MTDHATVRPMAPHYFVKPAGATREPLSHTADGLTLSLRTGMPCARDGCGLPPEHPVHLRPGGGDHRFERQAATG